MLKEQTLTIMKQLRLPGMMTEYQHQLSTIPLQSLSFDERLGMMMDAEVLDRANKKQQRLMRDARFKIQAEPEDIQYNASRGLSKDIVMNLLTCQWLENGQNVIITGPTGVGKTWQACALGHQAVRKGYPVLYVRLPRLIEDIEIAAHSGTLPKLRNRLLKRRLLIIDDWALSPLTDRSRGELLEIIDDRGGYGSLLITSQLPIEDWHGYIGEATLADAILDRLVHNSHHLKLKGESMRKKVSTLKTAETKD